MLTFSPRTYRRFEAIAGQMLPGRGRRRIPWADVVPHEGSITGDQIPAVPFHRAIKTQWPRRIGTQANNQALPASIAKATAVDAGGFATGRFRSRQCHRGCRSIHCRADIHGTISLRSDDVFASVTRLNSSRFSDPLVRGTHEYRTPWSRREHGQTDNRQSANLLTEQRANRYGLNLYPLTNSGSFTAVVLLPHCISVPTAFPPRAFLTR